MAQSLRVSRAVERLRLLVLPAILTAFGLQFLRVLFPSLVWHLREVRGVSPASLLGHAAWISLGGLIAALLWSRLQGRTSVIATVCLLAGLRIAEQVNTRPSIDLWLSLVGSGAFVAFLTAWFGHLRSAPSMEAGPHGTEGVFLGLALDAALKGLGNTLDLSWIRGPLPLATVLGLALLSLYLVRQEIFPAGERPTDPSWGDALPLFGLGPFLFLQLLVFQNSGWVSTVGGVSSPAAFPLIMLGNVGLCLGLTLGFAQPATIRPLPALLAALYLAGAAAYLHREGLGLVGILLVGQVVMGWSWSVLGIVSAEGERRGLLRLGATLGLGVLGLTILVFLYYSGFELPLPFDREILFPGAAATFGLTVVLASFRADRIARVPRADRTALNGALAIGLLSSIVFGLMTTARPPKQVEGRPLRVMTYNVHSAFDLTGRQDPAAIAAAIEASGAHLVALQEVSRGWLINGSTDLAHWLSNRLHMQVVFQGTSGPLWGNAILSSVPLRATGSERLPSSSALIQRGYLWVELADGDNEGLRLINTHLSNLEREAALRQLQAAALVTDWGGGDATLLVGDLNATPGSTVIARLQRGGFLDSWAEGGSGSGATYPSDSPTVRIDWILHTADLTVSQVERIDSQSSDHRPLAVTVERAR